MSVDGTVGLRHPKASFTPAERSAIIDAIRAHPELTSRDLANRLKCSTVTIWSYRKTMPALAREPLQAPPPAFDCFQCSDCSAEVVVGPISARGPRKCSNCRGKR